MSGATVRDLGRAASRGEERALAEIFREYHQPLYRFCLAIVGNPQDAQDALQNTMVKMLRALPGESRDIALKPWLYRVAHNESIDLLRRRRPDLSLEAVEPKAGEELATQVETRQRLRLLIADLSALPERQRETLLMREAAGLSFDEIGLALETSPAAARQTLYEARLGLRQMDAGREMKCETVTRALSDGDGRIRRRRDIQAHLRDCDPCRRFAAEIDSRSDTLAAISPLAAPAAAAILQGLVGGTAGGAGAAGGLAGGVALKSLGTATVLKGVATVAVVAAVGVGAADRAGLVHIGGGKAQPGATPGAGSKDPARDTESGLSRGRSEDEPHAVRKQALNKAAPVGSDADRARPVSKPVPVQPPASAGSPPADAPVDSPSAAAHPSASSTGHPHGRGHAKQLPAASAHGQETASSHKAENAQAAPGGPGESTEKTGGGEPPEKPAHAATPAAPAAPAAEPEAKAPPGKPPK